MEFFEGKQELYNILCLMILPILISVMFYLKKPKQILILPIIIMCSFLIVSAIFYPYLFKDIFERDYDSTTIYWLIFFVPLQMISALGFTVGTYFLIKRNSRIK